MLLILIMIQREFIQQQIAQQIEDSAHRSYNVIENQLFVLSFCLYQTIRFIYFILRRMQSKHCRWNNLQRSHLLFLLNLAFFTLIPSTKTDKSSVIEIGLENPDIQLGHKIDNSGIST